HQRRHVGAVEVGNIVGNIEEVALAGNHGLVSCLVVGRCSLVVGKQCINEGENCRARPYQKSKGQESSEFADRTYSDFGFPRRSCRSSEWRLCPSQRLAGLRARSKIETGNQRQRVVRAGLRQAWLYA